MKHKRKVKLGGVLVVTVLVISLVVFFFSKLNAPHQGVVQVGNVTKPKSSIDMTPKAINGTYASFNYPAGLSAAQNSPLVGPVVEQFNFMHRDVETWNLAIAVMHNYGGSIATNNAYQTRESKPNQYKETDETINGLKVVVITDKTVGGFSKVAILQNGSLGATISLVGDDPAGTKDLSNTFGMVISSWRWQ